MTDREEAYIVTTASAALVVLAVSGLYLAIFHSISFGWVLIGIAAAFCLIVSVSVLVHVSRD